MQINGATSVSALCGRLHAERPITASETVKHQILIPEPSTVFSRQTIVCRCGDYYLSFHVTFGVKTTQRHGLKRPISEV